MKDHDWAFRRRAISIYSLITVAVNFPVHYTFIGSIRPPNKKSLHWSDVGRIIMTEGPDRSDDLQYTQPSINLADTTDSNVFGFFDSAGGLF